MKKESTNLDEICPLSVDSLKKRGWIYRRTYDRTTTYGGMFPTKIEFELNDLWFEGSAFLEFLPETDHITIKSVDKGYNSDGPNCTTKFHGHCPSLGDLVYIENLIHIEHK